MKSRKSKITIPTACVIGFIVYASVMGMLILLSAVLLHSGKISITYTGVARIITLYIGATAGILSASICVDVRKFVTSIITGAIILILQMGIALIVYKHLSGGFILNVGLVAVAVITSITLSRKKKSTHRKRVRTHSM